MHGENGNTIFDTNICFSWKSFLLLFIQEGFTALHAAAQLAKMESVMVLLDSGADVNVQSKVST